MRTVIKTERAALVYQAGIANVFQVDCLNCADFGRNAARLMQSSFLACEHFAQGLGAAGTKVATFSCNKAGDIIDARWTEGIQDCPFRNETNPVWRNVLNGLNSIEARHDV